MLTTMTNRALVLICIAQTTNALYLSGTLADTDLDARASIHRETATAAYSLHTEDAYCSNRGGVGGSNSFSTNVGADNIGACASYVQSVADCGVWFNYGGSDGWCDCVPRADGDCIITSLIVAYNYDVYVMSEAQPTPAPEASATGDPHLQNIHGERFDLMRPGNTVLIQIPRGHPVEKALLTVEADARRLGTQCADIYFQSLNITGMWTKTDHHFDAWSAFDESPSWLKFGPVQLKVVRGYTEKGLAYLNFYVKHLGRAGAVVGGLLGEDDHTDAAQSDENCRKTVSLAKNPPQLRDGSLAMASSQ